MLIVNTPFIPDRKYEVLALVNAEVVSGMHIGKDFLASLADTFGGRSNSYESEIINSRASALEELNTRAAALGADAVIAADIKIQPIGSSNTMLIVYASGTAIRFLD